MGAASEAATLVIHCPYCGQPAEWVENREIYGRNYGRSYMAYLCRDCNAYVGCHRNTRKPLGTLANFEPRELRKRAHAHIDPVWKGGALSRKEVYARLSAHFGERVHIGQSDIERCLQILDIDVSEWRIRTK